MRIVYCIAGTRHSGGMERVLANKANWLVEHGYEVVIVTTDQHDEEPFFQLHPSIKCYDLAINYEDNNGASFLNKALNYPLRQFRHRKRLAALLRRLKADIVISMFCNDASFLPSINDGSAKILEIHFSRFKRLQYGRTGIWAIADRWRSWRDVATARRFDSFVVLTGEDRAYWGELGNITVIPNARSFEPDIPSGLENLQILAVGRLCYQKGFDMLVEVWRKVCDVVPGWTLRIVGSGESEATLRARIKELGLDARIEIIAAKPSDMPTIYRNASILVMSSRYEGLPMALLEGQASGLPIVSFACKCGPKDIIHDGVDGYIVPEGDIDAMAEKIISLACDTELRKRMGEAALNASESFSESKVMRRWEELFHIVCSKKTI